MYGVDFICVYIFWCSAKMPFIVWSQNKICNEFFSGADFIEHLRHTFLEKFVHRSFLRFFVMSYFYSDCCVMGGWTQRKMYRCTYSKW